MPDSGDAALRLASLVDGTLGEDELVPLFSARGRRLPRGC